MSDRFDMVAMETVDNRYLSGDASLSCSAETAAEIDREVEEIVKDAHKKALEILRTERTTLDRLAAHLLEKETITGAEFMQLLDQTV